MRPRPPGIHGAQDGSIYLRRQSDGSTVRLEARLLLGRGGEASVFALSDGGPLVAKVYRAPTPASARKLAVMRANPPADPMAAQGRLSIAWPVDLLCDRSEAGQVVGYLMPRAAGGRPIFHVYNPQTRKRESPLWSYLYLHRTARNLAAAIHALHEGGYVVGDINESNILVSDSALVTLVDTDSFQVRDPECGAIYRCPVGKPEFTPPELQGKSMAAVDRTPEHDRFGLGALIFQLLMEGTHPFSGVYSGRSEPPPVGSRIARGQFPYGTRRGTILPMPSAPPFDVLDPSLRGLFLQCFEDGLARPTARPSARTWQTALAEAEDSLRACDLNPQHLYGRLLERCPWCERTVALGGRDPFPSVYAVARGLNDRPARSRTPRKRDSAGANTRTAVAWSAPVFTGTTSAGVLPPPRAPAMFENIWAWVAGGCAALAMIPSLSARAGVASVVFAALGWRAANRLAGRGRLLAASAAAAGITGALVVTLAGLLGQRGSYARTISGPGGGIRAVVFSPDGALLAIGDERAEADRSSGQLVFAGMRGNDTLRAVPASFIGDVDSLAFSPDGSTLAVGSGGPLESGAIRLWDMKLQMVRKTLTGQVGDILATCYSPDGRTLASASADGTVALWNVASGSLERSLRWPSEALSAAFSPDGRELAVGWGSASGSGGPGMIRVVDALTGRLIWSQPAHSAGVLGVAFSPDGRNLASVGLDNTVRIWSASAGRMERALAGRSYWSAAVALSPDGRTLAAGGGDGLVTLWDASSGRLLRSLTGHSGPVLTVAFSPDGHTLASGGADGLVKMWPMRRHGQP